jgi:hypothetical protein
LLPLLSLAAEIMAPPSAKVQENPALAVERTRFANVVDWPV